MSSQQLSAADVVTACHLYSLESRRLEWSYADLADLLGVATSSAYRSVEHCRRSQVLLPSGRVSTDKLRDLLLHVVPLVFPAVFEGAGSGTPTATRASFSTEAVAFKERSDPPFVWSSAEKVRGILLAPLHPSVPGVAQRDQLAYELLALADVMRVGAEDDKRLAVKYVESRLSDKSKRKEQERS